MKTWILVILLQSIWVPHSESKCKTDSLTAAEQAALTAHNVNRALHTDTPNLCYGESEQGVVTYNAQAWADDLASRDEFEHSGQSGVGENLAMQGTSGTAALIDETYTWAANAWYDEINNWDFGTSAKKVGLVDSTNNHWGQTGHFTQVVWKDTTEVRCGFATYTAGGFNKNLVCCQYYPPGNYNSQYALKVAPLLGVVNTCTAPTVANGAVSPGGPNDIGTPFTVTCNADAGYKISESGSTITCSDVNGAATLGPAPTCNTTPCSKPTVTNGVVSPTTATIAHGEKYQLTCNKGFELAVQLIDIMTQTMECNGITGNLMPTDVEACTKSDEGNTDSLEGGVAAMGMSALVTSICLLLLV